MSLPGDISYAVRMDPIREGKLKPVTIRRYQQVSVPFVTWCGTCGLDPRSAAEWDGCLVQYLHDAKPGKHNFENLVAAVEFFFPDLRRRLTLARATTMGWAASYFVTHHIPLCRGPASLLALHLAARGQARMGAALVLQQRMGLRPGEVLGILASDIVLPEEAGQPRGGSCAAVIGLGVREGTKLKRAQSVLVFDSVDGDLI